MVIYFYQNENQQLEYMIKEILNVLYRISSWTSVGKTEYTIKLFVKYDFDIIKDKNRKTY